MKILNNEEMMNLKGGGAIIETTTLVTGIFLFFMGIVRGYTRCK